MTAIWRNDGTGWRLLAAAGFPDEQALHGLVAEAPQVLPLAGTPRLTVVGREVLLGGNYADLLAVEPSGRLAVIEIKLRRNAEARRAVVAQVLTYAAYLRGMDPTVLERDVLRSHLHKRGFDSLATAAAAEDQAGAFDATTFADGLTESLAEGRFRLVLVLDEAPEELVRLVGYLGAVADKLLIDLVTVAAYDIGGSQVVVPQRVDPERLTSAPLTTPLAAPAAKGTAVEGAADFVAKIDRAPEDQRPVLRRLVDWAMALEAEGLARLWTYHGTTERWTLLPYLPGDTAGLVTLWNDQGAYVQFHRTVFERRARASLERVEQAAAPARVGRGTTTRTITEELLAALTAAYREASTGGMHAAPVAAGDPLP